MNNIETQIINRLNKVLNNYNLEIICKNKHNYKTVISINDTLKKYCNKYALVEIDNDVTIVAFYNAWDKIESMLLGSTYEYSIFDSIDAAHETIKQYNDIGLEPYKVHILLDKLYNKLHSLNNCFCLEELSIKMDLMGI
jgi:hypothetical protein